MIATLLLLGCGDKEPRDSDSEAQCGSTQGFVYGQVIGFDGEPTDATVGVYTDGEDPWTAAATAEGGYELNLEGGAAYTLTAYDDQGCYTADLAVSVEACEELEQDLEFVDCDTVDKPNLYLYPERDTATTVTLELDPQAGIVASAPPYEDGWRGTAHTDGTWTPVTPGAHRAAFLFYEIGLLPWQRGELQDEVGFCVDDLDGMLRLLRAYGFSEREIEDYKVAWEDDLPLSERYAVFPQREVDGIAAVDIRPALRLERLWLLVQPGETCPEQIAEVQPLDRSGPHAVEWGVALRGFQ